jgi:hypothetical protein
VPSLGSEKPDLDGLATDLRHLIESEGRPGFIARLLGWI